MQQKRWLSVVLIVAAGVLAGVLLAPRMPAGAQGPGGGPGMPGGPGGFFGGRPMGGMMVATNDYLYLLRGNTLYQFSARDLRQLRKVTLPKEAPPAGMAAPRGQNRMQRPR